MSAALSLLAIVQEECKRQGIAVPAAITASTDETVLQMWGLLNEGVQELANRGVWAELITTKQFTHRNDADYGALMLDSELPDYKWMVKDTLWNLTTRLPVPVTTDEQKWWSTINMAVAPTQFYARILGRKLFIYPADVTQQFKFEYVSDYPVWANDLTTAKFNFTADTDVPKLPTRIVQADLKWRWRRAKGLSYAEEFRACEGMVLEALGHDKVPQEVNMGGGRNAGKVVGPGLLVAAGNWPL